MIDVRESLVSLWAKVIRKEIVQTNFWFLKNSTWKDMDVIGIKPGTNEFSLYNVKSNINTGTPSHLADKIADNFSDAINIFNKAFNSDFLFNVYLIFEFADLFSTKKMKSISPKEWLKEIEPERNKYRDDLEKELKSKSSGNIKGVSLKSIHECLEDIINNTRSTPTTTKTHCFEFFNQTYVYPYYKISEFKVLDIITNYKINDFKTYK